MGAERTYLVECLWPGVTEQAFADAVERATATAQALATDGGELRFLDGLLVLDDEVAFFRLAAGSRTAVEQACVGAALPYERILEYVGRPLAEPILRQEFGPGDGR